MATIGLAAAIALLLGAIGLWWLSILTVITGIGAAYVVARRFLRMEATRVRDLGAMIDRLGHTAFIRRSGVGIGAVTPVDEDGIQRDLTWLDQRLRLRAELLEPRLEFLILTRASLRAIADGVDSPVFATDEAGILRLVNRAGERIFRRRDGKLSGIDFEELFPQQALRDLHDRAQRGEACRAEVRLPVDDTQRTFEVAANPVRLDIQDLSPSSRPRAGVVLTLRDVTELSRTVQLRTDFVANASHELRTPIASIRGAVETLATLGESEAETAMRARLITMIEENNLRLEEMVADLLDLSNLESDQKPVRKELISITEAGETIRTVFDAACRDRRLSIDVHVPPDLDQINTDSNLFMLIVRNLVDNATKHAFEGTAITISVEPQSDPLQSVNAAVSPGIILRVSDQGEGIPLKHQARIFERFYQVSESRTKDAKRKGTGLGLAIVKHAAKRLEGEVALESVWQEGTTISVTLPGCLAGPDRAPGGSHRSAAPSSTDKRGSS